MARPKKPDETATIRGGVEALARLARRTGKGKRDGVSYTLPGAPSQLPANDMLIAVMEGASLTVQTVHAPSRLRGAGAARGAYARYVARRLAEIDTVVGELLATSLGMAGAAEGGGLTAEEDRALASGGFETSPLRSEEIEPLTETALEYARLLQSSLSVEQAARLLDVNPSRVRQRLTGHPRTLYGVKEGRSWRVPRFQFAGKKPVPGIARAIGALSQDLHPVAVVRWFTTPHPDLSIGPDEARPIAPLAWLRTGREPEVVAELARGV
jgi:hypothetical protein